MPIGIIKEKNEKVGTCFVGMIDFQLDVSKNRGTPKMDGL